MHLTSVTKIRRACFQNQESVLVTKPFYLLCGYSLILPYNETLLAYPQENYIRIIANPKTIQHSDLYRIKHRRCTFFWVFERCFCKNKYDKVHSCTKSLMRASVCRCQDDEDVKGAGNTLFYMEVRTFFYYI